MATIRLRMAESKTEITKPPAFLIIFASPFFKPRAAGSNSVSLVTYSLSFCCNVQPLSPWYIICLVMPPSMQMFSPVMKPALSEQRNGTPQRCIVQCLVHHLLWRLFYPWIPYFFSSINWYLYDSICLLIDIHIKKEMLHRDFFLDEDCCHIPIQLRYKILFLFFPSWSVGFPKKI